MMEHATEIAFALLGLALLASFIRLVRGPTLADRILALDTLTVLAVGVIGVFAARTGFSLYVDIAVALALIGFVSTLALARYLLSRDRR
jgi:multicomponent Na+:H+ antiporter subunit F